MVAGLLMVTLTGAPGLWLIKKLAPAQMKINFKPEVRDLQGMIVPLMVLSAIIYPVIYETFGYYVAWQNEHLRLFYSKSPELQPFFSQLPGFFSEGIYFFQVLRGILWVAITMPVVLLLRQKMFFQYALVGMVSALPAIMLFIPNPFMPADIAMSHFVETSTSNFLWGLVIVYATNRLIAERKIVVAGLESESVARA
jgi:hypothetical protein